MANEEKRLLKQEVSSIQSEVEVSRTEATKVKKDLEASEKARWDIEAVNTSLLLENKNVEGQLENDDANFATNFHNTEAYVNFSNYFTSVGQQDVLAAMQPEQPKLDLASLEV
ncbi:hypothetical protein Adt_35290 [Abeliophyllum distichum]|uniref:Uncharacterized protein n=1 Tax=Abeliophyllum distichum TaxID=126358 RepID=A0ABD1QF81_9LAMI